MNVAGSSGISAALLLQRLFGGGDATSSSTSEPFAAGQALPSSSGTTSNAQGASQAQMADGTMSVMVTLQMQGPPPQPPSASDVASSLIQSLDTDGDGELSADEIQKGISANGQTNQTTDISQAFAAMDTNGDGKISQDELSKAVQSDMSAHKAHHGHHHHGAKSAESEANDLVSAFDTNGDKSLSLDEITSGLSGTNTDSDSLQSFFSSLDANGDGQLSGDELTTGIQQQMMQAERAYAQSAATNAAAAA